MTLAFDDYRRRDLIGWGEAIRAGAVSASEVVEAAIVRAEAVNPRINAIAVPLFDRARDAAAAVSPETPFAGAPFAIKDLYQTIAGVPLTNGSRAFADVVSETDSEAVRRFKAAGLTPIATTTSPELGIAAATESTLHGVTRNPWDLGRTAGGSSGGSAALVAAGVLPAAHATDGGGSIRGPASCCGLFGLKPSRGRTPAAPGRTEGWLGLSTGHVVSRSVRDSAALLDALHGPDVGARYIAPPPRRGTFLEAAGREPGRLRIALHWGAPLGIEPDPVCVEAAKDAARLCESLGHTVEEAAPDLDLGGLARAFGVVIVSAVATAAQARAAALGVESLADRLEEVTRAFLDLAPRLTAADLAAANDAFQVAAIATARFQERYDLILSPTMGRPPLPVGAGALMQPLDAFNANTVPFSCFTAIQNETGQPAMSVPLVWSEDGLPIGVQFAARLGEEEMLFSLAAELERARPWFDRLPPL